jgi:hypothetical protein
MQIRQTSFRKNPPKNFASRGIIHEEAHAIFQSSPFVPSARIGRLYCYTERRKTKGWLRKHLHLQYLSTTPWNQAFGNPGLRQRQLMKENYYLVYLKKPIILLMLTSSGLCLGSGSACFWASQIRTISQR